MLVTVRLFARLREIAGAPELRRELPEGATARAVWDALVQEFPRLADYEATVSCAVNEEYARMATSLNAGDEVAFLPPVSGGMAPARVSGANEPGARSGARGPREGASRGVRRGGAPRNEDV